MMDPRAKEATLLQDLLAKVVVVVADACLQLASTQSAMVRVRTALISHHLPKHTSFQFDNGDNVMEVHNMPTKTETVAKNKKETTETKLIIYKFLPLTTIQ